jgi:hypothetical protein
MIISLDDDTGRRRERVPSGSWIMRSNCSRRHRIHDKDFAATHVGTAGIDRTVAGAWSGPN